MIKEMCKLLVMVLFFVLFFYFSAAAVQPPQEGELLPDMEFLVPENQEHQQYLGLSGKSTFRIPEINAEVVIIEIFSMY